jgi:hypothetical protein
MPGGSLFGVFVHPAPSWTCTGGTGAINYTDVCGVPAAPFGSQATRVVTAANSGSAIALPVFGLLSETDTTVTAPCSSASDFGVLPFAFIATLGSTSFGNWTSTVNAHTPSVTPRIATQTTTSGAQVGDSLVAPGTGTIILNPQMVPGYSAVGNCASASTTFTVKTNQGVIYP